jgi:hypothetical protein
MESLNNSLRFEGDKLLSEIEAAINYQFSNSLNRDTRDRIGEIQTISTRIEEETPFAMVTLAKTKWVREKKHIFTLFDIVPSKTRNISVNAHYDIQEKGKTIRKVKEIEFIEEEWRKGRKIYIVKGGEIDDKFSTLSKFEYKQITPPNCFTLSKEIIKVIKYIKENDSTI